MELRVNHYFVLAVKNFLFLSRDELIMQSLDFNSALATKASYKINVYFHGFGFPKLSGFDNCTETSFTVVGG